MIERRIGRLAVVLGLATLAAGRSAAAEETTVADLGPRVRVTTAKGRFVGRIVAREGETIVLRREKGHRTEKLGRPDVLGLEVSQRRSRKAKGAAIGALTGLGAAIALGVAAGEDCGAPPYQGGWANFAERLTYNLCFGHTETALLSGILTVPLGALLGALIAPGEKWRPAGVNELSVQAGAFNGGGFGVRLAVAF
jgi:hypothetical protein